MDIGRWTLGKGPTRIPFEFILDELSPLAPRVRAMFGAHAIYIDDKMVLIVREKESDPDDGVWLATSREHHDSLRALFPSLRSIGIFGSGVTSWQIIPSSSPTFEREAIAACELVLRRDPRIGRQPGLKKPKAKSGKSQTTKSQTAHSQTAKTRRPKTRVTENSKHKIEDPKTRNPTKSRNKS